MNKGLIFVVGLIAVLVVGLAVIGMYGSKDDTLIVEKNSGAESGTCEERCGIDQGCIANCKGEVINTAIKSGNSESCDSLSGEEKYKCMDALVLNDALNSMDIAKCEEIYDKDRLDGCKNIILKFKAKITKDATLCNQISQDDIKQECLAGI